MTTVWRIIRRKYQDTLFTGAGAQQYGSRWNNPGTAIVYTSASLSLAILEKMVHLKDYSQLLEDFIAVKAAFDKNQVDICELETYHHARGHESTDGGLPKGPWTLSIQNARMEEIVYGDWKSTPALAGTRAIGDRWAERKISPVLKVPSAIVPNECNYLLNPQHKEFDQIHIYDPHNLPIDPRLIEG